MSGLVSLAVTEGVKDCDNHLTEEQAHAEHHPGKLLIQLRLLYVLIHREHPVQEEEA